jgi:hypothetical protein
MTPAGNGYGPPENARMAHHLSKGWHFVEGRG